MRILALTLAAVLCFQSTTEAHKARRTRDLSPSTTTTTTHSSQLFENDEYAAVPSPLEPFLARAHTPVTHTETGKGEQKKSLFSRFKRGVANLAGLKREGPTQERATGAVKKARPYNRAASRPLTRARTQKDWTPLRMSDEYDAPPATHTRTHPVWSLSDYETVGDMDETVIDETAGDLNGSRLPLGDFEMYTSDDEDEEGVDREDVPAFLAGGGMSAEEWEKAWDDEKNSVFFDEAVRARARAEVHARAVARARAEEAERNAQASGVWDGVWDGESDDGESESDE